MLKRLELVGFKSFADKTAFDFPAGVTGIVGPNGSGKSNVVDAVRWVLGEQSAKSLRGGEMADVIFNGSASRRGLGMAEVTMTLDNSRRALATEADEVQITRRVYRGGEGEYLINQQPCRLRDVKELLLGSGAGADAYSIIEQGRVDVLLQASTKDRRTIFEEAAGISRFKAKKTEALRRLERVGQNLQRLRDILGEVEKQLRSARLQAAKAQRYQEYTARLRELRVALGLRDYARLEGELRAETAVLDGLKADLADQAGRAEAWERDLRRLEEALSRLEDDLRGQEGELAGAREQIASEEATLARERALADDLERDLAQARHGLAAVTAHVATLAGAAAEAGRELEGAEVQREAAREEARARDDRLRATEARLAELHGQVQREKGEFQEGMRQAARLHNDAVSYKAQLDNLARERGRLQQRSDQAAEHLASLDLELQDLTHADEALQARLAGARQALASLREERDRLRQLHDETAQLAADLRARRSGLASRVEVLEGLERSHEGLGTGAREVFALLAEPEPGPWKTVLGIVADFLSVRREYAPLIDLALGERAQRFLVRDPVLLAEALRERGRPFSGRVSFLPVPPAAAARPRPAAGGAPLALPGRPAAPGAGAFPFGVIAPARDVVRCEDPELSDLPARLLGRTLIVRDLDAARAVAALGKGYRCVTLAGELLDADGTLTVGTHHAEAGILSRKSELRELREQSAALDRRLTEVDQDLLDLRERAVRLEGRAENQQVEADVLTEQAADLRTRVGEHRQRRAGLHEEVEVSRSEITGLGEEIVRLEADWVRARDEAAAAEARVQALQARVEEAEREIRARDAERQG
jgi:chromosome segregation protein